MFFFFFFFSKIIISLRAKLRNFNIIQGENLILMFNIVSFDLKKKNEYFHFWTENRRNCGNFYFSRYFLLSRIKFVDHKIFIRCITRIRLTRNYYIESKLLDNKIFIRYIAQIIHVPCSRFSHTNSFATAILHHFITYPCIFVLVANK